MEFGAKCLPRLGLLGGKLELQEQVGDHLGESYRVHLVRAVNRHRQVQIERRKLAQRLPLRPHHVQPREVAGRVIDPQADAILAGQCAGSGPFLSRDVAQVHLARTPAEHGILVADRTTVAQPLEGQSIAGKRLAGDAQVGDGAVVVGMQSPKEQEVAIGRDLAGDEIDLVAEIDDFVGGFDRRGENLARPDVFIVVQLELPELDVEFFFFARQLQLERRHVHGVHDFVLPLHQPHTRPSLQRRGQRGGAGGNVEHRIDVEDFQVGQT